jgi:hypothetical protein
MNQGRFADISARLAQAGLAGVPETDIVLAKELVAALKRASVPA